MIRQTLVDRKIFTAKEFCELLTGLPKFDVIAAVKKNDMVDDLGKFCLLRQGLLILLHEFQIDLLYCYDIFKEIVRKGSSKVDESKNLVVIDADRSEGKLIKVNPRLIDLQKLTLIDSRLVELQRLTLIGATLDSFGFD